MKNETSQPDLGQVLNVLRAHVPELQDRYGVKTLAIFGSYARKTPRKGSDVDLLVEFDERPLTLLGFIRLEQYLSDLLHLKVDLVEKKALKPTIGRRILQELVPV